MLSLLLNRSIEKWVKRRGAKCLPVDVLAAVSKCSAVPVKFGNFVVFVVVVIDEAAAVWSMTGTFVKCCLGGGSDNGGGDGRFFLLFTDGRITSILSPCGRWMTVVVALLHACAHTQMKREQNENKRRQWIFFFFGCATFLIYATSLVRCEDITNKLIKIGKKKSKNCLFHLWFGRCDVFAFGGRGFRIGGLKSKCWCDVSTRFSVTLYAQHEPNINESTHIPICWPSDLMHSHTNIHVPP